MAIQQEDLTMADSQHLQLLQQGVDVWNEWRRNHPTASVDLSNATLNGVKLGTNGFDDAGSVDLHEADLRGANFGGANLREADLRGANLGSANLMYCNLIHANLSNANLKHAQLLRADLSNANLSGATLLFTNLASADLTDADLSHTNLRGASLCRTNLRSANLSHADLTEANLVDANFTEADLTETTFSKAILQGTSFGDRDFRILKGLEMVIHQGSSPLTIQSLYLSDGQIPDVFIRGTGVPDEFLRHRRPNALQRFFVGRWLHRRKTSAP